MPSYDFPEDTSHPFSQDRRDWVSRPSPAPTAILTRKECAAWLGISVRQLARLDIPCVKFRRLVRYSVPGVLRWMDERGQP